MAIPNRITLTCPACTASEQVVIGDSAFGPRGRINDTPIYSMAQNVNWPQTRRDGEIYLSCATCGASDFATLTKVAQVR